MKFVILSLPLLLALTSFAQEPLAERPVPLPLRETNTGCLVPDIHCRTLEGTALSVRRVAAEKKALVIAFTSPSCPLSGKLMPNLAALEKEFTARGAAFLYVNPTASDSADAITAARSAHGLTGSLVHDKDLALSAALHATSTTEVFVLDPSATITYRGAVDDQYGLGYAHDAPKNEWLRAALSATLAGQRPRIPATTAPGCVIALPEKKPAAAPAAVTWHGRVSRIVQANCQECHRGGGIAPFALESLEDVTSHAGMIKKVVTKGIMPPWFASPQGLHSPFSNDRSLTESDRTDFLAWLDGGRPEGDAADAPRPRQWPHAEWAIGQPETIYELPRAVDIKATGKMDYVNLQVETGLTEDKWVQSIEVLPSARAHVHHVLVFVTLPDSQGRRRVRDGNNFFAAYVPGSNVLQYPAGYAKRLPKGAVLHFQLHYTPTGTATQDRTRLGLIFAKEPPRYEVKVAAAMNTRFAIPPGAENHTEKATLPVLFESQVLAFMPHMHVRGKSFRYDLVSSDSQRRTVLDVPRYDFNWQLLYRLAHPMVIPAGSRLEVTAVFDNSTNNPANPNPAQTVRWGEQTDDEMLLGYVEYVNPAENPSADGDLASSPSALSPKMLGALGQRLDTDKDGRVSKAEAGSTFSDLFTRLDTNTDGFVTADEAKAALNRQR
jgi:peroxiredoxin